MGTIEIDDYVDLNGIHSQHNRQHAMDISADPNTYNQTESVIISRGTLTSALAQSVKDTATTETQQQRNDDDDDEKEVFHRERNTGGGTPKTVEPYQDPKAPIISEFDDSETTNAVIVGVSFPSKPEISNLSNVEPLNDSTTYNLPTIQHIHEDIEDDGYWNQNHNDDDYKEQNMILPAQPHHLKNLTNSLVDLGITSPISHGALVHSDYEEDEPIGSLNSIDTGTLTSALGYSANTKTTRQYNDNTNEDSKENYQMQASSSGTVHDL